MSAQNIKVSGTVVDEANLPLPGVTVKVKGTNNGVITDFDGKFIISSQSKSIVLVFSYIGMKSQELGVNGSRTVKVIMKEDSEILEEVVVIGYGAVKKKELTGAVAQVKGEELTKIITSDIGNALQGQVAGVNITAASGAPGESSGILIRGISSVTGSNTPLYVVDGVPQEGDPRLSPNEIETIDVLKDAASCAIYGTRGAAGVILITTKQGKEGAMKVAFNASYGIQTLRQAINLMNANEQTYFDIVSQRNHKQALDNDIKLEVTRRPIYFMNNTDLRDVIFKDKGVGTQNYSLNLSGGKQSLTYSVTAGYYDTEGVLINTGFQRFNTRANVNFARGKFSMAATTSMSVEDQQVGAPGVIQQALKYSPHQDMLVPGDTEPIYSDKGNFSNQLNWVGGYMNVQDDWHTLRASTSFNLNYDIIKDLRLSTRFSWGEVSAHQDYFKPYQEMYSYEGELLSKPSDSYILKASSSNTSLTWDMSLNYKKKIKDHSLNLLGVFSTESYDFSGFTGSKAGLIDNDLHNFNNATINPNVESKVKWNTDYTTKIVGVLGRVLYDWKSRYMVSASVRTDGSSRFNAAHRWGLFPSVSAAWNISDEPFWKPLKKTFNTLKLRASHGTTGNQNFAAYSYANVITNGYDAAFGLSGKEEVSYGATQMSFANPDVKWETTIQDNIGLDLAFLNNQITITAEYYNTRKKDMLFNVPLPSSSGIYGGTNVVLNVGNMTNSGYELAATYRKRYKQLWFQVNGTFSTNNNVITKLPGSDSFILTNDYGLEGQQITVLAEGYEAGAFFLYKTDGIINTQEKLAAHKKINPSAEMGDLIYRDVAGNPDGTPDGKISEADRVYCGSGLPKYELGLNVNLNYRDFDFSMQWYSALGHEIVNGTKFLSYAYGRNKNLVSQWSEVNPYSPIPAYRGDHKKHDNFKGYTDRWLEDGSYVRLKNVTLGYTIPQKVMKKLGISKLRIYLSAQNPLTLTKYSGYNPEVGGNVSSRGIDRANYPSTVTYTAGLNIAF